MRASELVAAIGPEASRVVAELFGGQRQDVPNVDSVMRATVRNSTIFRQVESMLSSGSTAQAAYKCVALEHRLTAGQVGRIVKMMREMKKLA